MDYYRFRFTSEQPEILMAFLAAQPFTSFEEEESSVTGYLQSDEYPAETESFVRSELSEFFSKLTIDQIAEKNWNAEWESSFEPVMVGDFCAVRASFHEPSSRVKYDIIVDPKMAFGTGHHATTCMMISAMSSLEVKHKRILDMGCGTGILAILASKMGAREVVAIDNDPRAVENAIECLDINQVSARVVEGSTEAIPDEEFDIVLANINRNALIDLIPAFSKVLSFDGTLLLSGLLGSDREIMKNYARASGFIFKGETHREDWICQRYAYAGK